MPSYAKHDAHVKKVTTAVGAATTAEAKTAAFVNTTVENAREALNDMLDEFKKDFAANAHLLK